MEVACAIRNIDLSRHDKAAQAILHAQLGLTMDAIRLGNNMGRLECLKRECHFEALAFVRPDGSVTDMEPQNEATCRPFTAGSQT